MPRTTRPRKGAARSDRRTSQAAPPSPPTAETAAPDGPRYLYGILRADAPPDVGRIGVGAVPSQVYAVSEAGLAAMVSVAPGRVVDPTRAHLLGHQRVTEALLHGHTVLPVAFGTVMASEAQVRAVLRTAHDALSDVLDALEGKVELGLKVLWHREHLAQRLVLEDARLHRRDAEPEAEHERRLEAAVEDRAGRDMRALLDGLRPRAAATREHPPVGERMLLNTAFLVERARLESFEAKVRSLAARSDTYTFRFTGPWAPYSFVDVRLGLRDEDAVGT
ncbi:GvpL/GvpF family gas vesicle protein [Myxococcus sp. AM009]|uniref:GvpL/GvpF family gas vesicle protein n=1 Tax=unclassified Myxococcus TaxID=2648731 RepID=UPI001594EFBB|nr:MULTISPECIES: GvpL/GvpF family gas vesicle protein [unclassified Myxococcus]NVJ00999.1 GvpL/GvpF family gas vesicle protein [Myxococcus sp. AM009]NVJ14113.1 GvpL/GvpF family gas vesicle protein [Myxococcus sp. AM010]